MQTGERLNQQKESGRQTMKYKSNILDEGKIT